MELMHDSFPEQFRRETARMEENKYTEEEIKKRTLNGKKYNVTKKK